LEADFSFENKDTARRFFQGLRQKFIEWNSIEQKQEAFSEKEKEIEETAAERVRHAKDI